MVTTTCLSLAALHMAARLAGGRSTRADLAASAAAVRSSPASPPSKIAHPMYSVGPRCRPCFELPLECLAQCAMAFGRQRDVPHRDVAVHLYMYM